MNAGDSTLCAVAPEFDIIRSRLCWTFPSSPERAGRRERNFQQIVKGAGKSQENPNLISSINVATPTLLLTRIKILYMYCNKLRLTARVLLCIYLSRIEYACLHISTFVGGTQSESCEFRWTKSKSLSVSRYDLHNQGFWCRREMEPSALFYP
jgi:hypothetical protein